MIVGEPEVRRAQPERHDRGMTLAHSGCFAASSAAGCLADALHASRAVDPRLRGPRLLPSGGDAAAADYPGRMAQAAATVWAAAGRSAQCGAGVLALAAPPEASSPETSND